MATCRLNCYILFNKCNTRYVTLVNLSDIIFKAILVILSAPKFCKLVIYLIGVLDNFLSKIVFIINMIGKTVGKQLFLQ